MAGDDLLFFAMSGSRAMGESVARRLGRELAAHEERAFEDGEHKCRPLDSVRARDVYVLESLFGEPAASVNDKLCRLLFFLGALKDAGAGRVTVIAPYLCYARKDRRTKPRDPVTTRYVAQLFEALRVDAMVTLDVHNLAAYQNAFRGLAEHLEARPLFVEHFRRQVAGSEVTVVAPDEGGVKRADAFRRALAAALGRPIGSAFMEKRRSSGIVSGTSLVGDVNGRVAIILDDLISTGGTLLRTAQAARAAGASEVVAAATHGLFNAPAAQTLSDPAIGQLVVTDSVPSFRLEGGTVPDKLVVLEIAPLVADCISRLHSGGSLVDLVALPEAED